MCEMWCFKVFLLILVVPALSSLSPEIQVAPKTSKQVASGGDEDVVRNATSPAAAGAAAAGREAGEGRRVYLEDVFYSLKSQSWEPEEQLCLNQTLDLLTNLQNFTLWAVSMWDATASEPRGMLHGTRHQLGNYDECLRPTWAARPHARLATHYCLADVRLLQPPRNLPKYEHHFGPYRSALDKIYYTGDPSRRPLDVLTWGTCVPAACEPRSVSRLLSALLLRSSLAVAGLRFNITVDEQCQRDSTLDPYPPAALAFLSIFGILSGIVIVCTILHWYYKTFSKDASNGDNVNIVVKAFSLVKNLGTLSKKNDSGLDVLYGIRYISICFIVTSHRYAVFSGSPLSNGLESDQFYQHPISIFLVHDDLLVDTFFLMSGLLVTKSLLSMDRFPNAFVLILKRYMRLAPGLAVLLFYMCAVFESAGSGPLWARAAAYEVEPCLRNWWLNLLMLSNYVRVEDMCVPTTWYIPCDFHYFLAAVGLCWLLRSGARRALPLAVPLALLALAVPAAVTAYYRLPAVLLFFNSFVIDPRGDETFQRMYIPSHTRAAPYLVGVAAGYLITRTYPIATTKKLSMARSTLGACASLLVMAAVMGTGSLFYAAGREYEPVEAAVYAAVNRPAWALAVAALVMCCAYGTVPLVTAILSWGPWVPLSKLAYGLYLTHMVIIARDVHSARDPRLYDTTVLIHRTAGDIAWGTLAALLLWLLVEAPCGSLVTACLAPRRPLPTPAPPAQPAAPVPPSILRSKC